jgi:2-polyprenyl-6-hydroxyphenyl methylase/3-demethylubiquinone-9 3-methyltransferase
MEIRNAIELHSRNARAFDSRYRTARDFAERYALWNEMIRKYSAPHKRVLDLGCGSGAFSFAAANYNETVLGVDGSAEMVALCIQKQAENKLGNISFIQSTIEVLPRLRLEPFDLLLCSSVLEYVEDLSLCLDILVRLVKSQGCMIISLPNRLSIYRRLERVLFRLVKRPTYLAFLRNTSTAEEFSRLVEMHGVDLLETRFYGRPDFISSSMPATLMTPQLTTLFLSVYRKR